MKWSGLTTPACNYGLVFSFLMSPTHTHVHDDLLTFVGDERTAA